MGDEIGDAVASGMRPAFREKFIAFVDVLGFKDLISKAEAGGPPSLSELRDVLKELEHSKGREFIHARGPQICPGAPCNERNLDFEVTQVSDCMIASTEISPAGVINLVSHCWGSAISLLSKGIMVRGYITRGSIFHSGSEFYGTGYHEALSQERSVTAFKQEADELGTPFVQLDRSVVDYANSCTDKCVVEMFGRLVAHDGDVWALYPFKRLAHGFIVAGMGVKFDPDKEKRSNDNLRQSIIKMRDRVTQYVHPNNEAALRKTRHYIRALEKQLEVCDRTDETIDLWHSKGFGS